MATVRTLLWGGRLHTVSIPADVAHLGNTASWTYAQTWATAGHDAAMRRVLTEQFPGIGWGPLRVQPHPFSAAASGLDPDAFVSEIDRFSRSSTAHTRSQMPPPPIAEPVAKHAASGTGGPNRPPPRHATSNASSRPGRPVGEGGQRGREQRPMQTARPHMGGWMGSAPTNGPGKGDAPPAS